MSEAITNFFCLLPLFASGIAFWILFLGQTQDPLRALIRASLLWGALALGLSEVLSLSNSLTFVSVWCVWSLASLLALAASFLKKPKLPVLPLFDFDSKTYLLFIILLALATGLIALVSAPNNYDVLFYHLPRVEHWIQDKNLHHFPSHYDLQDFYPFGGEAIVLQFRLLAGNDHFVNLPQWFAFLGCAVAAYSLTRGIGASLPASLISSLVAMTLPMAVLQSTTAQNDLLVSYWIVASAVMIQEIETPSSLASAAGAALAFGLALATKGTAYFYVFPLGLWLLSRLIRINGARSLLWLPALFTLMCAPSLGQWYRNFNLCGDIFGSASDHFSGNFTFTALLIQVAKNLVLHAGLPSHALNQFIYDRLYALQHFLGFQISDSNMDWTNTSPGMYGVDSARKSFEDIAGNPLQLCLVFFAPLFLLEGKRELSKRLTALLLCAFAGFLLYCFLVKWNPWASRLHMPFFILCAPWVGAAIGQWNYRSLRLITALLLLTNALFYLFTMDARPVTGPQSIFHLTRLQQTFMTTGTAQPLIPSATLTKSLGIRNLGLKYDSSDFRFEYLFWACFQNSGWLPHIECIQVKGLSAPLENLAPYRDFVPDAIIQISANTMPVWDGVWKGQHYKLTAGSKNFRYYVRVGFIPNQRPD